jgi:hypothetical protein
LGICAFGWARNKGENRSRSTKSSVGWPSSGSSEAAQFAKEITMIIVRGLTLMKTCLEGVARSIAVFSLFFVVTGCAPDSSIKEYNKTDIDSCISVGKTISGDGMAMVHISQNYEYEWNEGTICNKLTFALSKGKSFYVLLMGVDTDRMSMLAQECLNSTEDLSYHYLLFYALNDSTICAQRLDDNTTSRIKDIVSTRVHKCSESIDLAFGKKFKESRTLHESCNHKLKLFGDIDRKFSNSGSFLSKIPEYGSEYVGPSRSSQASFVVGERTDDRLGETIILYCLTRDFGSFKSDRIKSVLKFAEACIYDYRW